MELRRFTLLSLVPRLAPKVPLGAFLCGRRLRVVLGALGCKP